MKIIWRKPIIEETTFNEISDYINIAARSGGTQSNCGTVLGASYSICYCI